MALTMEEILAGDDVVWLNTKNKLNRNFTVLNDGKVNKDGDKVLSDNNFSDARVQELADKVDKVAGKGLSQNDFSDVRVQELADKVDQVTGKGLSTNDFSNPYKEKLDGLESSKFLGEYPSLAQLQNAHPSPPSGSYANVDTGAGQDVERYLWDSDDNKYVPQQGESTAETPASVRTKLLLNPDTDVLTDAEKTAVGNLPSDTLEVLEGKVDKVTGKTLSSNDFSDLEKTKLSLIEEEANKYILPSDVVQDDGYIHTDNNFTTPEKNKLESLDSEGISVPTPLFNAVGNIVTLTRDVYIGEDLYHNGMSVDIANDNVWFGDKTIVGKDAIVYADNGALKLSKSTTLDLPKLGGFHGLCADVGAISSHPLSGLVSGQPIPASLWDLRHRPQCEPYGMVYSDQAKIWVDIYLQSGTGAGTESAFEGTITDTRDWMDFTDDLVAVGKRMLRDREFQIIAEGSNQETSITGSAHPVKTGGHIDTAGRRMISDIGAEDCCGSLWQWLDAGGNESGSGWRSLAGNKGGFYGTASGKLLAGGRWDDGADCGSRARDAAHSRWHAFAAMGSRGCCGSL